MTREKRCRFEKRGVEELQRLQMSLRASRNAVSDQERGRTDTDLSSVSLQSARTRSQTLQIALRGSSTLLIFVSLGLRAAYAPNQSSSFPLLIFRSFFTILRKHYDYDYPYQSSLVVPMLYITWTTTSVLPLVSLALDHRSHSQIQIGPAL